ncbi:MAG: hypothetical protein R3E39_10940 [Anaerolineae bacterium]
MPVIFQKEMMNDGKVGISTMTFSLVRYEDRSEIIKQAFGPANLPSFASTMRKATKPHILFRSDLYPGDVQVTFEQIMNEYEGFDFETVYLNINTKWLPVCS